MEIPVDSVQVVPHTSLPTARPKRCELGARALLPEVGCIKAAIGLIVAGLLSATASASTSYLSYTGTLASATSDVELTFILSSTDTVTFQTWGFGGGTNANSQPISAGGFDPLIALFSGPDVPTANIFLVKSEALIEGRRISSRYDYSNVQPPHNVR